jgi:hypothetical protein
MFTADGMAAVRALHENPERLLLRNVAQFRQAHQYRPDDPDLNAVLARLEHEDGFRRLWAQTVPPGGDLIFLEHDLMRVRCPELGAMLVFNVARTRLVWDERFWFSHHWPADATTAAALVELARRIARDQRRACLAG